MRPTLEYAAIRAFVRGYLHQDAKEEYGSARAAAQQFCHDANRTQIQELRREWQRFQARYSSLNEINNTLQRFGCAWLFRTTEEFEQMLDVVLSEKTLSGGRR